MANEDKKTSVYASVLREIIKSSGGELLIEITNEYEEPFTIAYKIERDHKENRLFVRMVTDDTDRKIEC